VHVSHANRFARNRLARLGWIGALVYWGLRLRFRGVDLAIDVRGEFPLALLLWLTGARVRLGWNCGGGGFLLTHSPSYEPGRGEVDSRRALLAELGIAPDDGDPAAFARPQLTAPPPYSRQIAERLLRGDLLQPAAGPRVVLHVGAGTAAKRWPAEHWRELLRRLRTDLDARVILVGTPDERATAQAVMGQRPALCVTNWTGALTLMELAAVLEQSDLLVGADSGPAHLAAAVGTPVVTLFSGTNTSRQWMPMGAQVTVLLHPVACSPCHRQQCALGDHPCMRGLSTDQVWDAVLSGLTSVRQGVA
jgi:ADP-heptose:LPS heptosyltransferase